VALLMMMMMMMMVIMMMMMMIMMMMRLLLLLIMMLMKKSRRRMRWMLLIFYLWTNVFICYCVSESSSIRLILVGNKFDLSASWKVSCAHLETSAALNMNVQCLFDTLLVDALADTEKLSILDRRSVNRKFGLHSRRSFSKFQSVIENTSCSPANAFQKTMTCKLNLIEKTTSRKRLFLKKNSCKPVDSCKIDILDTNDPYACPSDIRKIIVLVIIIIIIIIIIIVLMI
jgi:hypothetical protein